MAVEREDPYVAFNFIVEIGGLKAGFAEVSGLDVEVQAIDYRNGDEDFVQRKLPGIKKFPNLTLKRGLIGALDLYTWIKSSVDGSVERRDGAIILRDEKREEVMRWKFRRGWACKFSGPSLKGDSNAVAMESLEICHEGLEIV